MEDHTKTEEANSIGFASVIAEIEKLSQETNLEAETPKAADAFRKKLEIPARLDGRTERQTRDFIAFGAT